MRFVIAIIVFLATPALAQVNCIPMTVVTPYSTGAIQSIGYNSDTKNLVAAYRQAPTTIRAFQGVPASMAQRFVGMKPNADAFFNANIAPYYHEGLLTTLASDMCPILNETGVAWLWTH
jgi:hypothetical protein